MAAADRKYELAACSDRGSSFRGDELRCRPRSRLIIGKHFHLHPLLRFRVVQLV